MSDDENALISTEEIRAIADGAHDILLEASREEWGDVEGAASRRLPLAFAALHFCALAAEEVADATLFDSIADAFALRVELEGDEESDLDALRTTTARLLAEMGRVDDRVIALAGNPSPDLRCAIAEGLRPPVPGATALLRKLVADTDPAVRAAARGSLGDAEAPWWAGLLSADPVRVVGEATAARIRPALEKILVKLGAAEYARAPALAEAAVLARKLPRAVAADFAAHALRVVTYQAKPSIAPLIKRVLAGPAPEAALDRLVEHWTQHRQAFFVDDPVAAAIGALPLRLRAELCRTLARRALEAPESSRDDSSSAASLRAQIAGRAWPKQLDYGFVLDAIDAREDGAACDFATMWVAHLLEIVPPRAAHVPRLVLRLTQSPSETWRGLRSTIGTHLAKLEAPALRPIAERAAASAEVRVVRWGLEMLATKARRPSESAQKLLRAWVADPRLLPAVASSEQLRERCLPLLRERLRTGALDFDGAIATIQAVRARREARGEDRAARVAAPLSKEERAAYRAARDREPHRDAGFWLRSLNDVSPRSALHPADRAFLAQAIEAAKEDRTLLSWIWPVLTERADADSLALATALLSVAQGSDREKVREACDAIAARLGVPSPPDPVDAEVETPAVPAPRAREWMDEPDD